MKRVKEVIICLIIFTLLILYSLSTVYADGIPFELREEHMIQMQMKSAERVAKRKNDEAVQAMSLVWKLEEGGLQDDATQDMLDNAIAHMDRVNDENLKSVLQGMAGAAQAEFDKPEEVYVPEEVVSNRRYYGECRITHYCPCAQCNGSWGNATASGAMPTSGWTVANGSLPFGTKVEINGHIYCVEDRGVGGDQFDIFVDSHSEALARGLYYTSVYIVD